MPAAFKLYPSFQTFFSDDGTLLAGGSLKFLAAGTSNTKNVFGEKALTTNNGFTVTLDAAARPLVEIWGSGQYDVELYDADSVKVGEDLLVEVSGGEATALPALVADQFLTNDGGTMSWAEIRELPDPTGNADKVLSTDGTVFTWIAAPSDGADGSDGESDVAQTATTFRVGNMLVQMGESLATANNQDNVSKAVTFATAFAATPLYIGVQVVDVTYVNTVSEGESLVAHSVRLDSSTGFTAHFNLATRKAVNSSRILVDIPFTYIAIGLAT